MEPAGRLLSFSLFKWVKGNTGYREKQPEMMGTEDAGLGSDGKWRKATGSPPPFSARLRAKHLLCVIPLILPHPVHWVSI